jgi:multimeric flavodoxin WrbA
MPLTDRQEALCDETPHDFSGLSAMLFNCSLKRDPGESHTGLLLDTVAQTMRRVGVSVERVHMATAGVAPGVHPDMTAHGHDADAWPALWRRARDAHIYVLGTPLWLGEESSLARILIERLYGMSGELNDKGQSVYYGKVGGAVVTGNEDGVKHAAMTILYAFSHLGLTVPPQADCGWIGEAGPGPSYGDRLADGKRAGFDNEFTQRNTTIMTWNLLHMARMLAAAGGLPNHGNDRRAWAAGCRPGVENPDHRA